MNRTVVILQHVAHEGPGRIAALAARRGLAVRLVRLDNGDEVPRRIDQGDVLVVMGGVMGVGDLGDPRFPFLARELDLMREVLSVGGPMLGVCLGAQLLAHAAGARVFRNPELEVGWGPVQILERGREAALAGLHEQEVVLHWHGDTFELPAGAVLLAASERCRHQMFRLGRAFGIQFHVELEEETIEHWLAADGAFVRAALGEGGAERIRAETPKMMAGCRAMGDRLLDGVFDVMLGAVG